ncbi:hypothetical protein CQ12_18490 [Bradyrhizobium jicamae]|uniref:Uncharacterized protein n=1 Tax=Bradyrhizobium jicamae TaxID=280332 RepID=A0A0R3LBD6_9BRAD|nr:hypothetical protein CQ12_18490 [Bradyrhizobium jicamae]
MRLSTALEVQFTLPMLPLSLVIGRIWKPCEGDCCRDREMLEPAERAVRFGKFSLAGQRCIAMDGRNVGALLVDPLRQHVVLPLNVIVSEPARSRERYDRRFRM